LPLGPIEIFRPAATLFELLPVRPKLVIFFAFFGVGQDFMGLIDFTEFSAGGFIFRIYIRMIFPGQLAVCLFNFILAGISIQSEYFVVVLLLHIFFHVC
jgi:hypothetical protein